MTETELEHIHGSIVLPDEESCLDALFEVTLQRLGACPGCHSKTARFYRLRTRKAYICQFCGFKIHPCANTILHHTKTSLTTWLRALYLLSLTRDAISTELLGSQLEVTYKCAWRIRNKLRTATEGKFFIGGIGGADMSALLRAFVVTTLPAPGNHAAGD